MEQSVLPRWTDNTRSEEIDQLVKALTLAQAKITAPIRNRTVKVTPRDHSKLSYSFKYATLDHIIEIIRPELTANGLWFTQIMKEDQGTYILDTRLLHGSGQWIACQTPLIWDGQGGNQQFGSALTFMRRYALTTLLGIAAEEDDDANTAEGNTIEKVTDRKPVSAKPDVMKEDPISTGVPPAEEEAVEPYALEIGLNAEQSGSDWVSFGKALISLVKTSATAETAKAWKEVNNAALDQMSKDAPKLFTNLSTSIIKAINDIDRTETGTKR